MRTVRATRYVTPLREGGSLPAIVEADDDGLYVLKFRGAGQGPRALIAELVAGEIGRALGLPVPEIVFVELDADLARTEPDPEIQDLIREAERAGLNLALDYLPGSVTFDPLADARPTPSSPRASSGSTPSSPTSTAPRATPTCWSGTAGSGSSTTAPRSTSITPSRDFWTRATTPFAPIKDHVLLPFASRARRGRRGDGGAPRRRASSPTIVALIPDDWLDDDPRSPSKAAQREAYASLLRAPPAGAARLRRGGRPCPIPARMTTRSFASCRASSAASSSTSARSSRPTPSGYLAARFERRRGEAARARPGPRPRRGARRARRDRARLQRRRRRRRDRRAAAARALPLAGRAAQHHDPDLGRAHRPLRRSRRRRSSSCSTAWCRARLGRTDRAESPRLTRWSPQRPCASNDARRPATCPSAPSPA